jgi:hypothetical protein
MSKVIAQFKQPRLTCRVCGVELVAGNICLECYRDEGGDDSEEEYDEATTDVMPSDDLTGE